MSERRAGDHCVSHHRPGAQHPEQTGLHFGVKLSNTLEVENERTVFDLPTIVNDHADEWQPRFQAVRRHISVITSNRAPPVYGTKGLAGQVLDVLIHNALKHGAGAVTLMIDGPSVVVIDQGPGMSKSRLASVFDGPVDPSAKHGRGLALARRLAQVDGGTLSVVGNKPLRLRFELVRGDVGTQHRFSSARLLRWRDRGEEPELEPDREPDQQLG